MKQKNDVILINMSASIQKGRLWNNSAFSKSFLKELQMLVGLILVGRSFYINQNNFGTPKPERVENQQWRVIQKKKKKELNRTLR